jgi:phage recombination protein Bet
MTALATLPTSSDDSKWSPEERALVEAAGLVHVDTQTNTKTLPERPVVAAFLQHCARTGLDPIARQIYSIARKSRGQLKWQIQISIDGARLVAERSGQYEGQTTPEFTADGITWTQVWLAAEPPKAARVGVYRRGFRDALYAIALWDAYVQRTYNGDVAEMWKKMGPLMLAKCAEMLALRKAFPQDLSGLYSSEEMAQADKPAPVEQQSQAAPAEHVSAPAPDPAPAEARMPSKDWLALANAARSREELRPVYYEAQAAGDLDVAISDGRPLEAYLRELRERLPEKVEDVVDAELVDEPAGEPVTDWPTAEVKP